VSRAAASGGWPASINLAQLGKSPISAERPPHGSRFGQKVDLGLYTRRHEGSQSEFEINAGVFQVPPPSKGLRRETDVEHPFLNRGASGWGIQARG
jgi:hypothetical protein